MNLKDIVKGNLQVNFSQSTSVALILEVQLWLSMEKPEIMVSGKPDEKTQQCLREFKRDRLLEDNVIIDKITATSLTGLMVDHQAVIGEHIPEVKLLPTVAPKPKRLVSLVPGYTVDINSEIVPGTRLFWREMTKNGERLPTQKFEVENLIKVAKVFGKIRDRFGEPIAVTSGFRPRWINDRIPGAAKFSQHIPGLAADIQPAGDSDLQKLFEIVRDTEEVTGLGVGMCRGFVHFDLRPGDRLVFGYGCKY